MLALVYFILKDKKFTDDVSIITKNKCLNRERKLEKVKI